MHSPEPWAVSEAPNILDSKGQKVGSAFWADDRHRVSACVNACAGISTEALEQYAITDLSEMGILATQHDYLVAQRDELLAASKALLTESATREGESSKEHIKRVYSLYEAMHAAIAKCENS